MLESLFNNVVGLSPAALFNRDFNTGIFQLNFSECLFYKTPQVAASEQPLSLFVIPQRYQRSNRKNNN